MKRRRTAVEAPRANLFMMEPEQLTIITDPTHPLYDERVHLPVSETMVASVMARGVLENVIARKQGNEIQVIAGRQRGKAVVEANKRLKAQGGVTIKIPVVLRHDNDVEAFATSIAENEHRHQVDVFERATKAKRLLTLGRSEPEVMQMFGITKKATLHEWLGIFELAPAVQRAIQAGAVGAVDAVRTLRGTPIAEQAAALETIKVTSPAARRQAGAAPRGPSPISRLRTLRRSDAFAGVLSERERSLIQWVFGEASDGDLVEKIPGLTNFLVNK